VSVLTLGASSRCCYLHFQIIGKNGSIHLFPYSNIGDAHPLSRASTVFNYKNTVSILYISSTVTTIDTLLQHPTTIADIGFKKVKPVSKINEVSRVRTNV